MVSSIFQWQAWSLSTWSESLPCWMKVLASSIFLTKGWNPFMYKWKIQSEANHLTSDRHFSKARKCQMISGRMEMSRCGAAYKMDFPSVSMPVKCFVKSAHKMNFFTPFLWKNSSLNVFSLHVIAHVRKIRTGIEIMSKTWISAVSRNKSGKPKREFQIVHFFSE